MFCNKLNSSISQSTTQSRAPLSVACHMSLIQVTRFKLWRFKFSAWIGTSLLASHVFQSLTFLIFTRRLLISSTLCRETCLMRQAKHQSGISRKHTAVYTRFAKSSYGETRTTLRVNHLQYILVYTPRSRMPASIEKFIKASCLSTSIYWYILVCTFIYLHVFNSMPILRTLRQWQT